MLFIKFLLSVREHYTFLIKQEKSYFPVLLFTTIWINSNKSPFPLTKMKLHLQKQLCEEPMSKLMQVMSRSMRFWFTINAKAKSRRYFLKKKKASQYDVRVCCSTSEVSKRLVISRPRTVFKNCCAPETILHFLRYWSCLCCWYYKRDFFISVLHTMKHLVYGYTKGHWTETGIIREQG